MALTIAICSIEKLISIKKPNEAVPKAVENTISAVVKALIEPMCFTPYISAQVAEPKTFARPLEIPISPRNKKAEYDWSKTIMTIVAINNGMFIYIKSFLAVNLSIKKPAINNVITESIE